MKITFIGFGNMASIIVKAAADKRVFSMANIVVSSPRLRDGRKKCPYNVAESNVEAVNGSDIVVLATKPPEITNVCNDIKHAIAKNTLIVSIAAGTPFSTIACALENKDIPIIRAMPNTALAEGEGMTGLCKNAFVTVAQEQIVIDLFSAAGQVVSVDIEDDLNKVTALSGSGPAYFYEIQIAMIEKAKQLGFSDAIAQKLVTQTMLGAAKVSVNSPLGLVERRDQVTSKGGTTAAALAKFRELNLSETLEAGIDAAYERARELSQLQEGASQKPFFFNVCKAASQEPSTLKQPSAFK